MNVQHGAMSAQSVSNSGPTRRTAVFASSNGAQYRIVDPWMGSVYPG